MNRMALAGICALGWVGGVGCGESFSASGGGQGGATTSTSSGGSTASVGGGGQGGVTASVGGGGQGGATASVGGAGQGGGGQGGATASAGGGGQGGSGGSPPVLCIGQSTCTGCLSDQCQPELDGCLGNAECDALVCCIVACAMEAGCIGACQNEHPDGYADSRLLGACGAQGCPGVCTLKGNLTECQTCTLTHCENDADNCHADDGCRKVFDCRQTCPDATACAACGDGAPPLSKTLATTLLLCRDASCRGSSGPQCVLPP